IFPKFSVWTPLFGPVSTRNKSIPENIGNLSVLEHSRTLPLHNQRRLFCHRQLGRGQLAPEMPQFTKFCLLIWKSDLGISRECDSFPKSPLRQWLASFRDA